MIYSNEIKDKFLNICSFLIVLKFVTTDGLLLLYYWFKKKIKSAIRKNVDFLDASSMIYKYIQL